jgi:hypothetical protein
MAAFRHVTEASGTGRTAIGKPVAVLPAWWLSENSVT